MALVTTLAAVVHLLFAGVWTGSVAFFAYAVLPAASNGNVSPEPIENAVGKLTTLSRTSSFFLLVSGGYMAGQWYDVAALTGTSAGHLVLTMVVLWVALTALVEVGASRMRDGLDLDKVRSPARESRRFFRAAAVVALLLLVDAGVLLGGV